MYETWGSQESLRITGRDAAQASYATTIDVAWVTGMASDFSDVRFSSADGSTALKYWRDPHYSAGVSAKFYVVIQNLPALGDPPIYIRKFWNKPGVAYAGETYGANGIFGTLDGGNASTPAHYSPLLSKGPPGAWDAGYIAPDRVVRHLRGGKLYRDVDGYAYVISVASTGTHTAGNGSPTDDDRPGLLRTLDFTTLEKVPSASPFLTWGPNGVWDGTSGTVWDGRVVQSSNIFYDEFGDTGQTPGTFICFYDGDAGPAAVAEAYRQGVAVAPALFGPWTKLATGNPSGQAWTFQSSYLNQSGHDDMVAYIGGFMYDPDEPDSNKRWKQWYTGVSGPGWGVMYATAPTWRGPWTRYSPNWVFRPDPAAPNGWYGGATNFWKQRGIYYMLWEKWAMNYGQGEVTLALSTDGINWSNIGAVFTKGTAGSFDEARVTGFHAAWDDVNNRWAAAYMGVGGTPLVGQGGATHWNGMAPYLANEPLVEPAPFVAWSNAKTYTVVGKDRPVPRYVVTLDVPWVSGMKANFDDIRFANADSTAAIKFWRESYTSGVTAKFHIVVSPLPGLGEPNVYFRMHWGNASANYAGEPYGANGIFRDYDGGNATTFTRPAAPLMGPAPAGKWDDSYLFLCAMVRDLDGKLYRDEDGYAWGIYDGSNKARRAMIDNTFPYDGESGAPGDDVPGLFRTLDFTSFEKVSVNAPIMCWGSNNFPSSWDPTSGTTWDGRVVQSSRIFYDRQGVTNGGVPRFLHWYDGDAGPAHVIEAYRQGAAVAPAGPGINPGNAVWTKVETGNPSGQKWLFAHSYLNDNVHADSVAYGGGIVYDPDEPVASRRWKNFYTGQNGASWGLMYATAPDWRGPWTRYSSTWLIRPEPTQNGYDGILENVWKVRGVYYMQYMSLGRDTDGAGRKIWSINLLMSMDRGITWVKRGEIFRQSSDSAAWDYARVFNTDSIWDPETFQWKNVYTGSAIGNGAYSDVATYVPPLSIGVATWTGTPPYLENEPLVFDFLPPVGRSLEIDWKVRSTVGRSVQLRWDTLELAKAGASLLLRWNKAGAVGSSLDVRWSVLSPVGRINELKWSVTAPTIRYKMDRVVRPVEFRYQMDRPLSPMPYDYYQLIRRLKPKLREAEEFAMPISLPPHTRTRK